MNSDVSSQEPLTAVVQRRIKMGCEGHFEELMQGFIAFALRQPGHLGINVIRPSHGSRDYTVVDRFASEHDRRTFTSSPEYRQWKERLLEVSDGEPDIQELGGLAGWFTLHDRPPRRPPPKYKMALATLLGVYPLSLLIPLLVNPLIGLWPIWLRALMIGALMVISLTWVVMPNLTRLLEKWLFKADS